MVTAEPVGRDHRKRSIAIRSDQCGADPERLPGGIDGHLQPSASTIAGTVGSSSTWCMVPAHRCAATNANDVALPTTVPRPDRGRVGRQQ